MLEDLFAHARASIETFAPEVGISLIAAFVVGVASATGNIVYKHAKIFAKKYNRYTGDYYLYHFSAEKHRRDTFGVFKAKIRISPFGNLKISLFRDNRRMMSGNIKIESENLYVWLQATETSEKNLIIFNAPMMWDTASLEICLGTSATITTDYEPSAVKRILSKYELTVEQATEILGSGCKNMYIDDDAIRCARTFVDATRASRSKARNG
tara:strand:- start:346 stop:978 length:633 start_codon:yes stop_codon:yes gene_type:complete